MFKTKLGGLYIEITSYCDRHCPYCYNDSNTSGQFLDVNTIYKLLDSCKLNNISVVSISGGEPFSHPNIEAIVNKLNQLNIKAIFVTNLSFLSPKEAIKLIEAGHMLQLTLDSHLKEFNDLTRGYGSYELTTALLDELKSRKFSSNVYLRYNINKDNYLFLNEIISFAYKYELVNLDFSILFKSGRASNYKKVFDYNNDIVILNKLVKEFKNLKEQNKKMNINYTSLDKQLGCEFYKDDIIQIGAKVVSNGDVYACQLFQGKNNVLGNVNTDCITDIIESEKTRQWIESIKNRKIVQKDCTYCIYTDICMCGCPAVSYMQTNSLYIKQDQCMMIKHFIKESLKEAIKDE